MTGRKRKRKTLFYAIRAGTQAEVASELHIDTMKVSRIARGVIDMDSSVIEACRAAWGDDFDEAKTLLDWCQIRLDHKAAEAEKAAAEAGKKKGGKR